MRTKTVDLGGVSLELAADFGVAEEIANRIADPLLIARESNAYNAFASAGIAYEPKWTFTVQNVCQLLHIGQKAAGGERTLDDIKALVFDAGFLEAQDKASDFLAMVVTPRDVSVQSATGDEKPGK